MRVLFLDIDGVLNSDRSIHGLSFIQTPEESYRVSYLKSKCDPVAVGLLNKITTSTDCKIVVSSANRKPLGLDGCRKVLAEMGVTAEILDITPSLMGPRGVEIKAWLDFHPEITNYVILDDSCDFLAEQHPHFVRIDAAIGINFPDVVLAKKILGVDTSSIILI